MKTPQEVREQLGVVLDVEDAKKRREKVLARLEHFMQDVKPAGKEDDWYMGYDESENGEIMAWVIAELNKSGWKGRFVTRRERMYSIFSRDEAGYGNRTILIVIPSR